VRADRPDDATIDAMFREYQRTKDRQVRNRLVEAHRGLAITIANDYVGRGVERDDLRQVALVGIVKAVERFDPERGVPYGAFASRTVNGEIKRYFRDKTWTVRPPREAQERHLLLRKTTEQLSHELGRSPNVDELAARMELDPDEVLDAMEASAAYRAASLDAPVRSDEGGRVAQRRELAEEDTGFVDAEQQELVANLLETLPEREAEIMRLRFYEDLTQSEIAERVGVSQMHVSRLLRRSLELLRIRLEAAADAEPT
jgi:RNA polymerase sigma-B factor